MLTNDVSPITVIVPAAGIGSRMAAATAKQYLTLGQKTVIAHTLELLVNHPRIASVIVALHPQDQQFPQLSIANHPKISCVNGGAERVDSVLNGLATLGENQWVMVHDAARPCLTHEDINKLLATIDELSVNGATVDGAILAKPAIDTMKQTELGSHTIGTTVDRETLWHALTPQLFNSQVLQDAIERAQQQNLTITDEASAMEHAGYHVKLVQGHASNIKITMPEDLALAEFYLTQQGRLS
ncbi:MAG: 2-C-methyl-D-erythritol 4-phosphate cytidylyltransferase [Glaciecola sp.]|jgi:2-C-methyl-D-erythritol 4-phosphate cytidylyltransferase|nr:2-C-methyl-D-erythritol 4-phosphate cytidylyltransferase [Glaciecola sp.]MDG1815347.1 2-C-methyl-D-erythritol 4-phosphate cytidylyltransferase [Glaciecola sp.]MDG2099958.1 2-C-methyl-D-erythritol 4-phosphate cytidylyltransferase [Glaciecola sp.]